MADGTARDMWDDAHNKGLWQQCPSCGAIELCSLFEISTTGYGDSKPMPTRAMKALVPEAGRLFQQSYCAHGLSMASDKS